MKSLEGVLKLADNEFNAIIANGKFRSREEIDSVYKLVDIVKDVHCIWAYEEDEDGYEEDDGSYRGGRSYRGGSSYAGRRGAKRDSMGRYSRDGYGYRGRDAKQDYIDELHNLMENAPDENTRQSIKRMIDSMQ